jgi:hypothetical protein
MIVPQIVLILLARHKCTVPSGLEQGRGGNTRQVNQQQNPIEGNSEKKKAWDLRKNICLWAYLLIVILSMFAHLPIPVEHLSGPKVTGPHHRRNATSTIMNGFRGGREYAMCNIYDCVVPAAQLLCNENVTIYIFVIHIFTS